MHQIVPPASYASQRDDASLVNDSLEEVDLAEHQPPPQPNSTFTCTTAYKGYDPHDPEPYYPPSSGSTRLGHQRSFTSTASFLDNCQPLIHRATTTFHQHSPTKSLASFIPSRTTLESTASQPKIRAGAKALQSWFNGASGRVNLGVNSHSQDHPDDDEDDCSDETDGEDYSSEDDDEDHSSTMIGGIFNRGGSSQTRSSSETEQRRSLESKPQKPQPQPPTSSSRFAWLLSTQKNAATPTQNSNPSPTYHNPTDELLSLNISQALFPHGPVDPLAPSSFNDLLSTAEALLSRYQTSYRQLSTSLVDARAEQSAQDDELDEADTRIRTLKSQMDTMAARAADQDEQMRRLMEELLFEKRAREESEQAQKRLQLEEETSPRRRNRVSNSDVSVDSGFESEAETDNTSIFSARQSLHSPIPISVSAAPPLHPHDAETTPKPKRHTQPPPSSLPQTPASQQRRAQIESWGCRNCEGGAQASVWGRLAKEREENGVLRRRVEVLEDAVEGALGIVDGGWIQ